MTVSLTNIFNVGNKFVADARNRLYKTGLVSIILKCFADFFDAPRQRVFRHIGVSPKHVKQIVLLDEMPMTLDQINESFKGLGLEINLVRAAE